MGGIEKSLTGELGGVAGLSHYREDSNSRPPLSQQYINIAADFLLVKSG
jgi:hypothetical protein